MEVDKKWGKKQVRSRAPLRGWDEVRVCFCGMYQLINFFLWPLQVTHSLWGEFEGPLGRHCQHGRLICHLGCTALHKLLACLRSPLGMGGVSLCRRLESNLPVHWLFLVSRISPLSFWIIQVLQVTRWSSPSPVVKRALPGCSISSFTAGGWDFVSPR